jgi:hypothetical protein
MKCVSQFRSSKLDDNLSHRTGRDQSVRAADLIDRKTLFAEKRLGFPGLSEFCDAGEYSAMMRPVFAGEQGKKGKYPRVAGPAKGKWIETMRSPTQTAYDMAGITLR